MEKFKKIGLKLLYPHIVIISILFPASIILMVWSMIVLGESHFVTIIGYVLSAYTLTTICFRIPDIIKFIKYIKNENKYVVRYRTDMHLRMKISLIATFLFNGAYAIFQFFIGLYHNSFWFYSMFAYYLILALTRFYLMKYTLRFKPNEKIKEELIRYRRCGWMLLLLNITLSVMVFFMVYWNRTFKHHEITTIALATYTFISFSIAIVNFIKYRKYKSPIFNAAKSISLISVSVSIITLEATMLTSFGADMDTVVRKLFLGLTGGFVSLFVICLALIIIIKGTKQLKKLVDLKENFDE